MKQTYRPTELDRLPRQPGVYYFHDRDGSVLYVGKATSLRARVSSYWSRPLDARLERLLPSIHTIKVRTTDTALEALILEANEIQRLDPPVNVRGKDGKTFAQIALTDEPYPRLLIVRPTQTQRVPIARTFGPYVSSYSAQLALKALRSIFKFNCGALPRGVTPKPRRGGTKGDLKADLGRPCLYFELGLCPGVCVGIITPAAYRAQIRKVVQFLEGKKDRLIRSTRRQMEAAARGRHYEEAARLRDELFALKHIRDTAFMIDDAQSFLEQSYPARLEAIDVSNLGSQAAVASLVVLEHGRPNPSQYRQFRIREVAGAGDVAMIREVIRRRLRHLEDWGQPDFLLVDGGVAQLRAAQAVLRQHRLEIPVAGVVKGPTRKLARLVLGDPARAWLSERRLTTQLFEPVVRLARDEAHRFAIKYHRKVRARRS